MAKVTAEKATAATAQLRQKAEEKDWTKEREYLGRTQKNLQGCVELVSTGPAAGSLHHSKSAKSMRAGMRPTGLIGIAGYLAYTITLHIVCAISYAACKGCGLLILNIRE